MHYACKFSYHFTFTQLECNHLCVQPLCILSYPTYTILLQCLGSCPSVLTSQHQSLYVTYTLSSVSSCPWQLPTKNIKGNWDAMCVCMCDGQEGTLSLSSYDWCESENLDNLNLESLSLSLFLNPTSQADGSSFSSPLSPRVCVFSWGKVTLQFLN